MYFIGILLTKYLLQLHGQDNFCLHLKFGKKILEILDLIARKIVKVYICYTVRRWG